MPRGYACAACGGLDQTIKRDAVFRLPRILGLHVVRVTYNMRTCQASKKCTTIRFRCENPLYPHTHHSRFFFFLLVVRLLLFLLVLSSVFFLSVAFFVVFVFGSRALHGA